MDYLAGHDGWVEQVKYVHLKRHLDPTGDQRIRRTGALSRNLVIFFVACLGTIRQPEESLL